MKKLLVVLLTIALVMSIAVLANAATVSTYVGGEAQVSIYSSNGTLSVNTDSGSKAMVVGKISAKVEDDNTWASITMAATCWGEHVSPHYALGFKNIGDLLDVWYNTDEERVAGMGQIPLFDWNKWGGDPFFTSAQTNSFFFKLKTDSVAAGLAYDLNQGGPMKFGAFFNFDGGDIHVGYGTDWNPDYLHYIAGGAYKLEGFGTLKLDYDSQTWDKGVTAWNRIQAAVDIEAIKLEAIVQSSDGATDFISLGLRYNGIEKTQLGVNYALADNTGAAGPMEVYVQRSIGVLDARLGYFKPGTGDATIYVSAHCGMW